MQFLDATHVQSSLLTAIRQPRRTTGIVADNHYNAYDRSEYDVPSS